MEIKSAEFVKGIIGTDPILEEKKLNICFIGRSNVGKSSLINSLLNKKDLVRSGSMPGKTRQIDYFLVNDDFYFVDLPGYGYAQIPAKQREKLRKLILWYLFESNANDLKTILIIDAEVGPKPQDMEILEALRSYNKDFIIVANKADKIKKRELNRQTAKLTEKLGSDTFILYSAKTKKGREELLNRLFGNDKAS